MVHLSCSYGANHGAAVASTIPTPGAAADGGRCCLSANPRPAPVYTLPPHWSWLLPPGWGGWLWTPQPAGKLIRVKSAAGEGSTAAVDLYISRVIGGAAPLCTSAMYMGHDKGERGAFVKKAAGFPLGEATWFCSVKMFEWTNKNISNVGSWVRKLLIFFAAKLKSSCFLTSIQGTTWELLKVWKTPAGEIFPSKSWQMTEIRLVRRRMTEIRLHCNRICAAKKKQICRKSCRTFRKTQEDRCSSDQRGD